RRFGVGAEGRSGFRQSWGCCSTQTADHGRSPSFCVLGRDVVHVDSAKSVHRHCERTLCVLSLHRSKGSVARLGWLSCLLFDLGIVAAAGRTASRWNAKSAAHCFRVVLEEKNCHHIGGDCSHRVWHTSLAGWRDSLPGGILHSHPGPLWCSERILIRSMHSCSSPRPYRALHCRCWSPSLWEDVP